MADEMGFQVVSRKKRKKLGKWKNNSQQTHQSDDDCNIDRIITQIESHRCEIEGSNFHKELKEIFTNLFGTNGPTKDKNLYISKDKDNPSNVESDGVDSYILDIVCYGIGCIRSCPNARYQFALLIILKQLLKVSSQNCFIYEPLFNKYDEAIVQRFGCSLIEENEEAKRYVLRSTLFYMPHCSKLMYNNVVWANWGQTLKNVVIFGNRFSSYEERLPSRQLFDQVMYVAKILPYTTEVRIPNSFYHKDIFNDSALHLFNNLDKLSKDFWTPCPEPLYGLNNPEIVTKQQE